MPTAPPPTFVPALRQGLPVGLHVVERAPSDGWDGYRGPVVVLVHGSLDRAASFSRVIRRLPDWGVVAYDRRG
jgi:pimeloyl-ACP methyl ester carboxylesterase